jgi:hypothetical protein
MVKNVTSVGSDGIIGVRTRIGFAAGSEVKVYQPVGREITGIVGLGEGAFNHIELPISNVGYPSYRKRQEAVLPGEYIRPVSGPADFSGPQRLPNQKAPSAQGAAEFTAGMVPGIGATPAFPGARKQRPKK